VLPASPRKPALLRSNGELFTTLLEARVVISWARGFGDHVGPDARLAVPGARVAVFGKQQWWDGRERICQAAAHGSAR